ncbi:MAG: acyl-ACP--UDP-N-acetylglucosamine O-acyltransferase [Planctomycetaceae bacterium]|nr:acyl-ACP--UDP-N-acetylglucosamine O-acyltransferase [Planctomycetaceae bacterium]MCA9029928.1 acyl-ACP--UDP-N-acetylglucosamine O-acyltransferase [Planctomycetaceae bacterium]MCB9951760.1 acyl-ACP--UDP-N-acetylglucosamine O-acyltransferase [Planctomycetaceae bacterium]
MATTISPLASVDERAKIGENVTIGPFCLVGPEVVIGNGCTLDSHVALVGKTTIGENNRFWPNCVIGAEPQDKSFDGSQTSVEIGNNNQFREGVTINRGAEKEDGVTRVGNYNLIMSNAHIAHNCHIFDHTILVNGVLLGGHVHVHDRAIVSGNSVVHHFSTIGKLAFVSGGCRVPRDIPPYMLAAGSDNPELKTINLIGLQRAGLSKENISLIREAFKLLMREHQRLDDVRAHFQEKLEGIIPMDLAVLLDFVERTNQGRMGRAREAARTAPLVVKKDAA